MAVQTAYTLNNKAGLPGMLFDNGDGNFVDSKPCGATALFAGQGVELVAGVLRLAQGTGDPNTSIFWGVVVFKDSLEPNPSNGLGQYLPGMDVPILRVGRIWALLSTVAVFAQGAAVNYTHSSTLAVPQGFTSGAVLGTVGSEVSATKAIWYQDGGLVGASPSVAGIELNLP